MIYKVLMTNYVYNGGNWIAETKTGFREIKEIYKGSCEEIRIIDDKCFNFIKFFSTYTDPGVGIIWYQI